MINIKLKSEEPGKNSLLFWIYANRAISPYRLGIIKMTVQLSED